MKLSSRKLSAFLIMCMIIVCMSGCGKEEEEPYVSPSFIDSTESTTEDLVATITDASISDALMIASFTDATMTDASATDAIPASLTDALPMGVYEGNVYYNLLAEFKITVDDNEWRLYDAAGVATATGATEDYVNNLWYGYKSPYDEDTTYAAIAYNVETGSNIIVTYINTESYQMPDFSAQDYLEMAAKRYDDLHVSNVIFLRQQYYCLDIPEDQSDVGRRVQFAIDKDGLIILISFTLHGEMTLEEAVTLLTPLYY